MSASGNPKAMIAMSGGVDSSVAALLAARMGYECTGVTMKLYADTDDAGRAAETLGIPHHIVDFSEEFRARVIEPFAASYENGETPNPCILCNTHIKFGLLYEYARANGFEKFVTGHYARITAGPGGTFRLARAADAGKDQSYFLYGLEQEKLARILFPLGGLTKKAVRAIAAEAGLENAEKRESQDICFVPGGGYADFIGRYRGKPRAAGNFVDTDGRVLGRHDGVERYTVGQRKGLGVAFGRPVYVREIRPETQEVVLAGGQEVYTSRIVISDVSWLMCDEELRKMNAAPMRAQIMIRYRAKPAWATVMPAAGDRLSAEFDEPVRAPAKGQAAVLYDEGYVLGGGRIAEV